MEAWNFRERVSRRDILNLLHCISDVADALGDVKEKGAEQDVGLALLSAVRRIAMPIRKILLDGNGHLIKACFTHPSLHPFMAPDERAKPITFVQKFDAAPMEFGWADGSRSAVEVPAYEQRTTNNNPPAIWVTARWWTSVFLRTAIQFGQ